MRSEKQYRNRLFGERRQCCGDCYACFQNYAPELKWTRRLLIADIRNYPEYQFACETLRTNR